MHADTARRLVLDGLYKRIKGAAEQDCVLSLTLYRTLSAEHIAELRKAGYSVQVRDEYDSVVISWK